MINLEMIIQDHPANLTQFEIEKVILYEKNDVIKTISNFNRRGYRHLVVVERFEGWYQISPKKINDVAKLHMTNIK